MWRSDLAVAVVHDSQVAELSEARREDTVADYLARYPKG